MSQKRDVKHYLANKIIRLTMLTFLIAAITLTAAGEEKAWIISCMIGTFISYGALELNAGYAQLVDMTVDGTKPLDELNIVAVVEAPETDPDPDSASASDLALESTSDESSDESSGQPPQGD